MKRPGPRHSVPARLAAAWTTTICSLGLWRKTTWFGVPVQQWPTDLLVLQELIVELRPTVVIEAGTNRAGTALFFASIFELLGNDGRVISIDLENERAQKNVASSTFGKRVSLLRGDSKSRKIHDEIAKLLRPEDRPMVFLDSCHESGHVLEELRLFQRYVPVGGYLVLFDTVIDGISSRWRGRGPMTALGIFLKTNADFASDRTREKFFVTLAPCGFLKRVRQS